MNGCSYPVARRPSAPGHRRVDAPARQQLACVAQATGGCYLDAPDPVTLAGALNRMRRDAGARVLLVEDQQPDRSIRTLARPGRLDVDRSAPGSSQGWGMSGWTVSGSHAVSEDYVEEHDLPVFQRRG